MSITAIDHVVSPHWDLRDLAVPQREALLTRLEAGDVLCFDALPLDVLAPLGWLLDARWADPRRKNISLDPTTGAVAGVLDDDERARTAVAALLADYGQRARQLIDALAPGYGKQMRAAAASLRLLPVEGRETSWRKDDSRLHVDAFPSRPNQGERILRVFRNVNPQGVPRVWRVGEPFADVARRFQPRVPRYSAAQARWLRRLRVTKALRSAYDHIMLSLHDQMKADLAYQRDCPQATVPFPAGATWVCFSDQTAHAAMSGQFMLEQTLHPALAVLHQPEQAPLAVLERLWRTRLT